eukprot:8461789-Lingulodinium_polyedra.AAC.1
MAQLPLGGRSAERANGCQMPLCPDLASDMSQRVLMRPAVNGTVANEEKNLGHHVSAPKERAIKSPKGAWGGPRRSAPRSAP